MLDLGTALASRAVSPDQEETDKILRAVIALVPATMVVLLTNATLLNERSYEFISQPPNRGKGML